MMHATRCGTWSFLTSVARGVGVSGLTCRAMDTGCPSTKPLCLNVSMSLDLSLRPIQKGAETSSSLRKSRPRTARGECSNTRSRSTEHRVPGDGLNAGPEAGDFDGTLLTSVNHFDLGVRRFSQETEKRSQETLNAEIGDTGDPVIQRRQQRLFRSQTR
jgi:hypothetical protein